MTSFKTLLLSLGRCCLVPPRRVHQFVRSVAAHLLARQAPLACCKEHHFFFLSCGGVMGGDELSEALLGPKTKSTQHQPPSQLSSQACSRSADFPVGSAGRTTQCDDIAAASDDCDDENHVADEAVGKTIEQGQPKTCLSWRCVIGNTIVVLCQVIIVGCAELMQFQVRCRSPAVHVSRKAHCGERLITIAMYAWTWRGVVCVGVALCVLIICRKPTRTHTCTPTFRCTSTTSSRGCSARSWRRGGCSSPAKTYLWCCGRTAFARCAALSGFRRRSQRG